MLLACNDEQSKQRPARRAAVDENSGAGAGHHRRGGYGCVDTESNIEVHGPKRAPGGFPARCAARGADADGAAESSVWKRRGDLLGEQYRGELQAGIHGLGQWLRRDFLWVVLLAAAAVEEMGGREEHGAANPKSQIPIKSQAEKS